MKIHCLSDARFPILTFLVTLTVVSFIAISCGHVDTGWKGKTAKHKDNTAIVTGKQQNLSWKSRSVDVDYTYSIKNDNLSIEGTVNVAHHIENTFMTLHYFSVFLNLLDDSNLILDSRAIVSAGSTPIRPFRFKEEIPLPPGATQLNFSYSGVAAEGGSIKSGGDDGGVSYSLWQNP